MLDLARIKAIGFDLDGTLYQKTPATEHRENEAVARVILKHNKNFSTYEATVLYVERQYALLKSRGKIIKQALSLPPGTSDDSWMIGAKIHELLVLDKKLAVLLTCLKKSKRYTLYLCTSAPREAALQRLDALAVNPEWFSLRVYGDTPGAESKSNGSAFIYACNQLDIPPRYHCYVGDREKQDILPAHALGMQTIAVWSEIPAATISIKHINDLEQLLL